MSKRWKKAPKIIGMFEAIIAIAIIALVIFVVTRPKEQTFDDSKLAIERPHVSKFENGYYLFAETVGTTDDIDDDQHLYEDIYSITGNEYKLRYLSDKDLKRLESKYGEKMRGIEKSIAYKYFVAPEIKLTPDNEFPPMVYYLAALRLSTLNLAFAWHDFRINNTERGMQRLESTLRLRMILQNDYDSLVSYMLGISIQNHCFDEINALLDQNLIPEDQLPRLLKILGGNGDYITGIRRAIAVEYKSLKIWSENYMKNDEYTFFQKKLFNEKKTRKKFYDFWVLLFDWAGQPYNARPHIRYDEFRDNSFIVNVKLLLSGNADGETKYNIAMPNLIRVMGKISFHESQLNSLCYKIALLQYFNKNHELPRDLDALVPEYIPAVPRDPFDGKPLRYDPKKKIVYSVGYNLKDDGGTANKDVFKRDRRNSESNKDLVLPVMKSSKKK